MKNADGVWQIASTRDLKDSTDAAGQLADLADVLKGGHLPFRRISGHLIEPPVLGRTACSVG